MSAVSSTRRRPRAARRVRFAAIAAGVLVALILLSLVPGSVGTIAAALLPWLGVPAALLALTAGLLRRAWWLACAPFLAWALAVSPAIAWLPGAAAPEPALVVAAQNVHAGSSAAGGSAAELARRGAQVIALTELDAPAREQAAAALAGSHPYSTLVGTVGLWSTLPIVDSRPLDLGLGWRRALQAELDSPDGPIDVYVIHAASFRPGAQAERDTMLRALGETIAATGGERVIAVGDFNAASTDPALAPIRAQLAEPRPSAPGFGFTWPAGFPVARIDHVFQRGFAGQGSETLALGDSDHRAIIVALDPVA